MRRLPIRLRLALAFAAAMTIPLGLLGAILYGRIGHALLEEIDTGLSSRAEALETRVLAGLDLTRPQHILLESDEAFTQVTDEKGTVLESNTPGRDALIPSPVLRTIARPTFIDRRVQGVADVARLLAVPIADRHRRVFLVVGASMQDRGDTLRELTAFFALGGPIALVWASIGGWLVAGYALRPVEHMRRQASAISASELARRLSVPAANDEIRRLASTLNDMLGRLEESAQRERRFLDDASHELRTPLTALKAELDLTRSRPRNPEELSAALESASEEADRLARMAEDLLVLSRAHGGHLPVHRETVSLREVIASTSKLFRARAHAARVAIDADAPEAEVFIDGTRAKQAIVNLVDNALRHTPPGGAVRVRGETDDGVVRIVVEDEGPGFPAGSERRAFEPFYRRAAGVDGGEGAGLGLAIVRAIAESHDGSVLAENKSGGGARVTVTMRTST